LLICNYIKTDYSKLKDFLYASCWLCDSILYDIFKKIIIVPRVLYECDTWSLTLREERRLKAFENRVLRGIFGPTRDEVTGD
jgi:hypothetical protein